MGGGIGSMKGAGGMISKNKCFENFYAGIGHNGASPIVESNICFNNVRAGIGISSAASPIVKKKIIASKIAALGLVFVLEKRLNP